ncbi:calcipressin-1-like [Plakobranchus ocellatus]|uniref:Calcipressin-1-like n=1 Tax=Plakobranchus ocellatus TaxID=259542 RepID=A0AAV3YA59_9GAST|nr:calcipressin-1-like [Plakobranchus ocellatus]
MDFSDDIDELCEDMDSVMDMSDLDDLPTAIIVTNVPQSVFSDADEQAAFEKLFLDLDGEATFVYLKNFKRARIQFSSADTAGIARIKNDGIFVSGQPIRCYFFQLRTVADDNHHLQLPQRTKMFLISPPSSPPVGWEPRPEAEPVVNYDLLSAIANLSPGESHELHPSTIDAPAIVVHMCEDPVGFGTNLTPKPKIVQTRRPGPSSS